MGRIVLTADGSYKLHAFEHLTPPKMGEAYAGMSEALPVVVRICQ